MDPFEADSLAAASARRNAPVFEATVFSALTLALAIATRPDDPMSVNAAFPWPVLTVALVGLRYGFPMALLTAGLLHVGAYLYGLWAGLAIWPLPFAYSVGFAIVSVITGEYRESWGRRLDTVERSNAYRQARLEEFTQTYHVLKLSHDRLEQDNAGNQTSLRSSLLTIRGLFTPGSDLGSNSAAVMDLFRRYCAVVSGGLFVFDGEHLRTEPVASIGKLNQTLLDDILVRTAIDEGRVTSVNPGRPESMAGRKPGDPLIVVPFVDSFGQRHAVLVVSELPFFSYTERTLQLMAILGGQIADFSRDRKTFPDGLDVESASFVSETLRSLEYAVDYGLATTLVAIQFADQTAAPAYLETIDQQSRGLDRLLAVGEVGARSGLLIMPLTGGDEYEQFLTRFDRYLTDAHGVGAAGLNIENRHLIITSSTSHRDIAGFLANEIGDGALSQSFLALQPTESTREAG